MEGLKFRFCPRCQYRNPARKSHLIFGSSSRRNPTFGVNISMLTLTSAVVTPRPRRGTALSSASLPQIKSSDSTNASRRASAVPISPKRKCESRSMGLAETLASWSNAPAVPLTPGSQRKGLTETCQSSPVLDCAEANIPDDNPRTNTNFESFIVLLWRCIRRVCRSTICSGRPW